MKVKSASSLLVISMALVLASCDKKEAEVLTSGPALKTIQLFDGKTLDGWEIVNNGQFSVEGGMLKIDRGTGWLRSQDTFGDFTLKIEFRFLEAGSNSGIFVRTGATSNDDENGWPNNGLQMNCFDSLEGDSPMACPVNYGIGEYQSSIDHDALAAAHKPAGEWEDYQIVCMGDTVTSILNGKTIAVVTGVKKLDGHIGLQGEHGVLEFRKIEVEVIE